jgi:hypothetical protein
MLEDLFGRGRFASSFAITALVVVLPLLLGLAIPYAILHYRDSRAAERDPQIGLKAALYFFLSVSVFIFLLGASIVAVDTVDEMQLLGPVRGGGLGRPMGGFSPMKRSGAAFMFTGFTFGLVQFVLIHMTTNNRRFPLVRRIFGGWRLAVEGMVVLTWFTILVQTLFQQNMPVDEVQDAFAVLFVWSPAWLVDLILLRTRSQQHPLEDEEPIPERFGRTESKERDAGSRRREA